MPTLSPKTEKVTLTGADLSDEGVYIQFSDGTLVLFKAQFLYDVRDQDANLSVAGPEDER